MLQRCRYADERIRKLFVCEKLKSSRSLWLFLCPVFQIFRTFRIENVNTWNKWVLINIVLVVIVDVAVVTLIGPNALMYLIASMFFALGFHPLGARWVQEHYTLDGKQETHSYYGPMNKISMYIGYHVEHHDFPYIAWHRLPEVRRIAPEFYDDLPHHTSWMKVIWMFIYFGPQGYTLSDMATMIKKHT